jgi:kynurenine formamidase
VASANIDSVIGTRFRLSAMPLKIRDGTGSPIRLFAIVE